MSTSSAVSQFKEQKLVINSTQESIFLVESLLDNLNEELRFRDDVYGNIIISVTEAVNNSIIHGNGNVPDRKIELVCRIPSAFRLSITVTDEGAGFNPENVKDPTLPENIEQENGRGLFVMKSLADDVIFHGNGNTVEMIFNI